MVKTSIRVKKTHEYGRKNRTMQPANVKQLNGGRDHLRNRRAGFFAVRFAFVCAEKMSAMRMRMHAEQADAVAAAL